MHESGPLKMVKTYRKWLENGPIISNLQTMDKSAGIWYTANDYETVTKLPMLSLPEEPPRCTNACLSCC